MESKVGVRRLTIMVETPWESFQKDFVSVALFVAAGMALHLAGVSLEYWVGGSVFVASLFLLSLLHRSGVLPGVKMISAPPHEVGALVDQWLEEQAEDEDE